MEDKTITVGVGKNSALFNKHTAKECESFFSVLLMEAVVPD